MQYAIVDIELMLRSLLGLGHLRERNFKHAISKILLLFYVYTVKLLIYQ